MKVKLFTAATLILFFGASFAFPQEPPEKDKLYIQMIFEASEEGASLKEVIESDVNRKIRSLGDIVITDKDYEYIISVFVDRRKGTSGLGMSSIVLTANVTKSEPGKAPLFSAEKTGAIYEIREICKGLVADIDEGFLKGKYKKGKSKALSQIDIDRRYARARVRERMAEEAEAPTMIEGMGTMDRSMVESLSRELLVAGAISKGLSDAEMNIIQMYPDKAHRIGEITQYAKNEAERAHKMNWKVPQDAYRHVLWSYLLTKEFGPEVAKEITDAHEAGMTGNTPAERDMDYNNNAVGRDYALSGYSEDSIMERVMRDRDVIRSP